MKISKLIKALQEIQKVDGDTDVCFDYLYHNCEAYLVKEDASSNCELWSKEVTDAETVFYVLKEETVDDMIDKSIELVTKNGLIDLKNPLPSELMSVPDTAINLARKYRWDGNTNRPISIARHLVVCAIYAPDEYKKEALLHDLTEAYIGDMARPLKSVCPDFCNVEDRLHSLIAKTHNLPETMSPEVKQVDDYVQRLEAQYLDTTEEAKAKIYSKLVPYKLSIPQTDLTKTILERVCNYYGRSVEGPCLYPRNATIRKDTEAFLAVWELLTTVK